MGEVTESLQRRIDETALAMWGLPPDLRHQCLCEAFDATLAKHPELTEVPPGIVMFVAAVLERIAEFERQGGVA